MFDTLYQPYYGQVKILRGAMMLYNTYCCLKNILRPRHVSRDSGNTPVGNSCLA